LVVVFRLVVDFDFAVVDFFTPVLRLAEVFFAAPDLAPDVEPLFELAVAPDEDTRDECFVRCVVRFFVCLVCVLGDAVCAGCAASATPINANDATSATASILMVLRIIKSSASTIAQSGAQGYSRYASANPIWATNIILYMCAHDTWFSSTASSSGRLSIR
jgi:hypothetical protein